jgi:hypothetical protein
MKLTTIDGKQLIVQGQKEPPCSHRSFQLVSYLDQPIYECTDCGDQFTADQALAWQEAERCHYMDRTTN